MIITDQVISDRDYWSDIFKGIAPDVIPLEYVDSVSVMFTNNKQWEIPVENLDENWTSFQDTIIEFISGHAENIKDIGYNVDLNKIRLDISSQTVKFLLKYKL